jgi:MFS-type transporter involved in bile tolerance (Atg22 family)
MYGLLWRLLPGPAWVRVLILLLLAVAVVAACFAWVFPWLSDYMPINDNTVEVDAP